jgi:hypothetical protein
MTLCLAWRDTNGHVHLASDSRVKVASNSFEDIAVKVTRIPCEIFPPSSSFANGTGDHQISLGMAFAGNHVGAYAIKESLIEVLGRLQHVPGVTELSMDKIVKIAFHTYESLSKKLCSTSIAEKGICEIFLVGLCQKRKSVRAFKFSTDPTTNSHFFKEILVGPAPHFEMIGSGRNAQSLGANASADPIRALKAVIEDPSRQDVGGAVQYGTCANSDFTIYCECLNDYNDSPVYMRAGLDINGINSSMEHDDLVVAALCFEIDN